MSTKTDKAKYYRLEKRLDKYTFEQWMKLPKSVRGKLIEQVVNKAIKKSNP